MGVPATGRRVRVPGILLARVHGGKVAEYWREEDQLGLLLRGEIIWRKGNGSRTAWRRIGR